MLTFRQFKESKENEDKIKQAIFAELGINPDHAESRMDDKLESFSDASELEKMAILDELPPDVKATTISVIKDGNSTLRDLINTATNTTEIYPKTSSNVEKMEPLPRQTGGI